jgi:hypothetical protein
MYPFIPFRVTRCIWFFVLGLKYSNNLSVWIPCKVTTRATLRDHTRVNFFSNSVPYAFDNGVKFGTSHYTLLWLSQTFRSNGPNTVGRPEHGMLNLKPLILANCALASTTLELGRNLIGPALETGVDGFDVDTAGATDTPT